MIANHAHAGANPVGASIILNLEQEKIIRPLRDGFLLLNGRLISAERDYIDGKPNKAIENLRELNKLLKKTEKTVNNTIKKLEKEIKDGNSTAETNPDANTADSDENTGASTTALRPVRSNQTNQDSFGSLITQVENYLNDDTKTD